jgi:hypothetical protein
LYFYFHRGPLSYGNENKENTICRCSKISSSVECSRSDTIDGKLSFINPVGYCEVYSSVPGSVNEENLKSVRLCFGLNKILKRGKAVLNKAYHDFELDLYFLACD